MLLGLFSKQAFPLSLIKSLIGYTFEGSAKYLTKPERFLDNTSKNLWKAIRSSIICLPDHEKLIEETDTVKEARDLNKIESQYWLLIQLSEKLQVGSEDYEVVFWKLRELEEERQDILQRLEPLKKKYLRNLDDLQQELSKFSQIFASSKQDKEIEDLLNNLVINLKKDEVTELEIQELLETVKEKAYEFPNTQRIYNVWRLIDWVYQNSWLRREQSFSALDMQNQMDSHYPPVRAHISKSRTKYHLPHGCHLYPKVENESDVDRIYFFLDAKEAERSGFKICGLCKKQIRT